MAVKLLLNLVAMNMDIVAIVVSDVKCAFLYGKMCGRVYCEFLEQDPPPKGRHNIGRLRKAMYGTRGPPQLWSE